MAGQGLMPQRRRFATPAELVEMLAAYSHQGYMAGKRAAGTVSRHSERGEEVMVPFEQLSEASKDISRAAAAAMLDGLSALGVPITALVRIVTDDNDKPVNVTLKPGTGHDRVYEINIDEPTGRVGFQAVTVEPPATVNLTELPDDTDNVDRLAKVRAPCEHCPDGHTDPRIVPFGVYLDSQRDSDGQPTRLIVMRTQGSHVAESDADWLWQLIRDHAHDTELPPEA